MRIGIDFGTSFSKTAAVDLYGEPIVLKYATGFNQTIPSVFYYDRQRGINVGNAAERLAESGLKDNLVRDIKLKLISDKGKASTTVLDGNRFTSTEIVSSILRFVGDVAAKVAPYQGIDGDIEGAVVTIPVKFTMSERRCLLHALQTPREQGGPGLKVLGLLNEPVAAALSYCRDEAVEDGTNVLVYDLGGGTCDVSVIRADSASNERFKEVESDMIRIGGSEWDKRLQEYLIRDAHLSHDRNLELPPQTDIRKVTIQCKEMLSDAERVTASFGVLDNGRYVIHEVEVTRDLFERMTQDLLDETMSLTESLVKRLPLDEQRAIRYVVCVGGGSNMPQVGRRLREMFPDARVLVHQPEYAVVRGAALYAEHCDSEEDAGRYIRGKSPASYGIRVHDHRAKKDYIRNLITVGDDFGSVERVRLITPPQGEYANAPVEIYENDSTDSRCEMFKAFDGGTPVYAYNVDFGETMVGPGTPFDFAMTMDSKGFLHVEVAGASGTVISRITVDTSTDCANENGKE